MTYQRVLGILTAAQKKGLRYGEMDQLCREMIAISDLLGWTTYIFSPEDIQPHNRISAWRFDELGGRWYSEICPEPQVVYDRLLASKRGYRRAMLWIKSATQRNTLRLNSPVGNKYQLHRIFRTSQMLRKHLPHSEILHSRLDIKRWLRSRGNAYIKPISGSQGKGVFRVTSDDDLRERFPVIPPKRLLIQEEIPIRLYQGRRPDLRCFMQKDYHGVWKLTFSGVRLGARGSDVSNLHQGGEGLSSESYLRFLSLSRRNELYTTLEKLNRCICSLLEDHYGFLCELGIDWGIDSDGKPWLIEVNPKPGRRLMSLLGAEAERLLSLRRVLECAELRLNAVRRRGKK